MEGPEITILKRNLKSFIGKSIINISVLPGSRYQTHFSRLKGLNKRLPKKILDIKKKGKLIYFVLESEWGITFYTSVSGTFLSSDKETQTIHSNFRMELYDIQNWDSTIDKPIYLFFDDSRKFGKITIYKENRMIDIINSISPDFHKMNLELFLNIIKFNKGKILASVLVNKISGIGGYLRSEALYKSRLNPFHKAEVYTDIQLIKLFNCLKDIFQISLNADGLFNKKLCYNGYFNNFHVYKRKRDLLGHEVLRGKSYGTVYWVPAICEN